MALSCMPVSTSVAIAAAPIARATAAAKPDQRGRSGSPSPRSWRWRDGRASAGASNGFGSSAMARVDRSLAALHVKRGASLSHAFAGGVIRVYTRVVTPALLLVVPDEDPTGP